MTDNNPYKSPSSDLQPPGGDGYELGDPRVNSASKGVQWLIGGIAHLSRDLPMWLLTVLVGMAIMGVLMVLQPFGTLVVLFTAFVWHGGLLLGCRAQADGEPFSVSYLFAGFREHAAKLILLSLVSFVLNLVIFIVSLGPFYALLIEAGGDPAAIDPNSLAEAGDLTFRVLVAAALTVPFAMAFWFAPCLIVMHNVGVAEAIRLSFIGCRRNTMPFLIYGVVAIAVFFVTMLILGVLSAIPGVAAISGLLSVIVLVLGGPIFFGSVFVAYRDIFVRRGAAA